MAASEKSLENWAGREFKKLGWRVVKLANLAGPGFPDHSVFMGDGRVGFVEYKTPKGRFGPLQEYWLDKLGKLGHPVAVCRSHEDVREFIKSAQLGVDTDDR